jgi:Domain of unknown function (DUF4864)
MNVNELDRFAIRSVVEQQLQAFQNDDAIAAFSFASPTIQAQFQTPDQFMEMVRTAYSAVYRPRSVVFEAIANVEGYPAQTVLLMDAGGDMVRALYLMQKQDNETWCIHGCLLMPLKSQSV